MSEEAKTAKEKAQALARARTLQRNEEGTEVEAAVKVVREAAQVEEQLFAQRGYGGYIDTDHLESVREEIEEAVAAVESLRAKR